MRLSTRTFCAAASGLLVLGASLTLAGPASAIPPVTMTGSAPATAHGPGTLTFTYTIVVPTGGITATTFTTAQDPALPALAQGVTLDGAAVPAGQITPLPAPSDITVQLGALAAGSHTVTFDATVGTTTATTSSSAALTSSGGPATSPAVVVALNQIDIATVQTPGIGENQTVFLGTGEDLYYGFDVQNIGYGAPGTQLVLDLGTGLTLGPDGVFLDEDGSPLACPATVGNPQQLVCDLGPLSHTTRSDDPTVVIDLAAAADAPIGQTVAITATASPETGQGTDVNPANDSATGQLKFTGAADLTTTLTPATKNVELGATTTVRLTVHNAGPQVAGQAVAVSFVTSDNIIVTGFSGNTTPPQGMAIAKPADEITGPDPNQPADPTVWYIGDIATGHSVSATLTIKATALGTARISTFALSQAADPTCPDFDCAPTVLALNVVPVPPPVVTAGTTASGLNLASTGPQSGARGGRRSVAPDRRRAARSASAPAAA